MDILVSSRNVESYRRFEGDYWKLASIIGMLVALGLNIVFEASALTVFIGSLVIQLHSTFMGM